MGSKAGNNTQTTTNRESKLYDSGDDSVERNIKANLELQAPGGRGPGGDLGAESRAGKRPAGQAGQSRAAQSDPSTPGSKESREIPGKHFGHKARPSQNGQNVFPVKHLQSRTPC